MSFILLVGNSNNGISNSVYILNYHKVITANYRGDELCYNKAIQR